MQIILRMGMQPFYSSFCLDTPNSTRFLLTRSPPTLPCFYPSHVSSRCCRRCTRILHHLCQCPLWQCLRCCWNLSSQARPHSHPGKNFFEYCFNLNRWDMQRIQWLIRISTCTSSLYTFLDSHIDYYFFNPRMFIYIEEVQIQACIDHFMIW